MSHVVTWELRRPDETVLYRALVPASVYFSMPVDKIGLGPVGEVELYMDGLIMARGVWPDLVPVGSAA